MNIENGLVMSDKGFNTSVLISLFGGNVEDSGKVENRSGWWGNYTAQNTEKIQSRFQAVTNGNPLTVANAKEAINAAKLDLDWIVSNGIADEIAINGKIAGVKRLELEITLIKDGADIFSNTYSVNWEAMRNGARK
jgi:phage gp46-like protein